MFPRLHFSLERWRKNTEYGVWVSNQGRVRLIKNKKFLEPRINKDGYCLIFTDLGAVNVHRLVAYTWMGGKRNAKYDIDHINSNKRDNSVKNLRWVTREVNLAYAAFTQCNSIEETEPQTSTEEKEDILSILFNNTLLDESRSTELKKLLEEKKVQVYCGNKVITTFDELRAEKEKRACTAMDTDKFVKRVLMAAQGKLVYCGQHWQIKVIE